MAKLGSRSYKNAARSLHAYVHRKGKTLPIPISTTKIRVRQSMKTVGEITCNYPFLRLSSWMKFILEQGGEFLLGGCKSIDYVVYTNMFGRFWHRFKTVDPTHPVYEKDSKALQFTIPICIHGDEGRGLGKQPCMVTSYQPMIPFKGENTLNSLGQLGTYMSVHIRLCTSHL